MDRVPRPRDRSMTKGTGSRILSLAQRSVYGKLTPRQNGRRSFMLYSPDRTSKWLKFPVAACFWGGLFLSPLPFPAEERGKKKRAAAPKKTLTGEIINLMCSANHTARGNKHA